jgi:hypothetical protein
MRSSTILALAATALPLVAAQNACVVYFYNTKGDWINCVAPEKTAGDCLDLALAPQGSSINHVYDSCYMDVGLRCDKESFISSCHEMDGEVYEELEGWQTTGKCDPWEFHDKPEVTGYPVDKPAEGPYPRGLRQRAARR